MSGSSHRTSQSPLALMSVSPTGPPTLAGASAGQRGETAEWPRLAGRTAEAHEPPVQSTPPFLTRSEHPWPVAPVPFGFSLQILVIALWPLAPRDSQLAVFRLTHRLRRLTQSVPRILSRVPWGDMESVSTGGWIALFRQGVNCFPENSFQYSFHSACLTMSC